MAAQPATKWKDYADDRISFRFPARCSARSLKGTEYILHSIRCGRDATVTLTSIDDDMILETLRSHFDSFEDLADAHLTRKAVRRGRVAFTHSYGDELLVLMTRNSDRKVMSSYWELFLNFPDRNVHVNLIADGPVDEHEWLQCFDSIELCGE